MPCLSWISRCCPSGRWVSAGDGMMSWQSLQRYVKTATSTSGRGFGRRTGVVSVAQSGTRAGAGTGLVNLGGAATINAANENNATGVQKVRRFATTDGGLGDMAIAHSAPASVASIRRKPEARGFSGTDLLETSGQQYTVLSAESQPPPAGTPAEDPLTAAISPGSASETVELATDAVYNEGQT